MPFYVGCFIKMVRALIGYGTYVDAHMPRLVNHPRYPTLAAGWGTHDPSRILAHIERGLMRARILLRYLEARAKAGLEIDPIPAEGPATAPEVDAATFEFTPPAPSPEKRPQPSRPLPGTMPRRNPPVDPDHPLHFHWPTARQLWADMRNRSVTYNVELIVSDLGGHFGAFGQAFHHNFFDALIHFAGDIVRFNAVHQRRQQSFMEERERRPETWTHHLWDRTKDTLRDMLGFLMGEDPPAAQATPTPAG